MKDIKLIVIFVVVGLALAHFVGAPLRRPASSQPQVGTPLDEGKVYAEGTIKLAANLQETAANYGALFLIVRPQGVQGAPIAAKRIATPSFPLSFKLTERNNMVGEGFYEGDITVVARLDQDGAAGPKQPGDMEGSVDIKQGSKRKVSITINN